MLIQASEAGDPATLVPDQITTILIDSGPDMREQLLDANVGHLDAVVLTHSHADHIFGLDDLRQLWVRHRERVNVYLDEETRSRVFRAFSYCFEQAPGTSYSPFLLAHAVAAGVPFSIEGKGGAVELTPIQVEHGDIPALGIRVNNTVYMPDVKTVKLARSKELLADLDLIIIDALRYKAHPTHMNLEEALAFVSSIKPRQTILTNMHGDMDYATLVSDLPETVTPAYDGLSQLIV